MNSCLILLTNYFPYFKGEEYLETELPILAKKFKKIYIISCMANETYKKTRSVPKNVIVIPSGVNHNIPGRIKMLFKSIFTKTNENKKLSVTQNIYSKYFETRSKLIFKEVKSILEKYDFDKFDSVILYSYWMYITARVGIELKNELFMTSPLITRAHGYDVNEFINPLKFLPQREYILDNCTYVFPISDFSTSYLTNKYQNYKHKIKTLRLGINSSEFKHKPSEDHFHVVSCSTVRKLKRVDIIIGAVHLLQKNGYNIKWTHIGDGELSEEIHEMAFNKLYENTYNFTGYIPNQDVIEWYRNNKSNLFLNVSSSEGLPVSIMEAISIGLPVVATDVGGTKEIVLNNENGYLLGKDVTDKELAEAILKVMSLSKTEYKKMSDTSIHIWEKYFKATNNYNDFSQLLLNISLE